MYDFLDPSKKALNSEGSKLGSKKCGYKQSEINSSKYLWTITYWNINSLLSNMNAGER